ncbi:sorting nexin-15 isoform X3 [Emydura macquarii macquarii]|uniref:sorting nexin-15 isoform X3 n=1 Tax=Emydura macquarii macquarii TaxID=1129001 RepID=UPI00352AD9F9
MACRVKDEYQRHYTVTEPRSHPKGHTEYKVTAKFVSKTNPEDVKEITVWKRYSDFKKLHGDLSYIHRNLFRRMEEFPAFPKAQVFGRFEPEVIEERRKAAEAMLRFTVHIPALNNSPQLKEFFRGGEVKKPLEACDLRILPPPLIPVPQEVTDAGDDARGSVAELGLLSQEPELHQREQAEPQSPVPLGAVEAADEAHNTGDEGEEREDPTLAAKSEDLDLLFASVGEEEEKAKESGSPLHGPLSDQDLALFDPFIKEGDPDPARREAVKKKTAEYLQRAEELVQLHLTHLQP